MPLTQRSRSGRLADQVYVALTAIATVIGVVAIAYLIVKTVSQTGDTWDKVGFWNFLTGTSWIPSRDVFGALPSIYGTLVTASIAMVIAVPIAVGCALATTLLLPHRLRGPIASVIDLLAAIPSVVYGLFGLLVLVPFVKPGLQWVADHSGPIGFLHGPVLGGSLILASFVLAVMVLPIITAITREVLATVPVDQQEAAYALGATRWEMVKGAMLPWARSGIVGASALGLGRAVGETIAVAMVLGNSPKLWGSLLGSGQTMAGAIALEFNAAVSKLHQTSLVALAVYLFVVAFLINVLARLLVTRSSSPEPGPVGRNVQAGKAWV
ncbi:MAG TPA: phosphate ABC transporter permease subunit PstC, partial [Miltoncostaeaceae bacterium]|nr:phosphate ABC transporter permease subunit PstC [Miltoncostaeaceae bacterium]